MKKQFAFLRGITILALIQILTAGSAISQASLHRPIAAYHYATPFTQVRSLNDISVRFVNKEDSTLSNVVVKAAIHEPGGNVVTLSATMPSVEAGVDTIFNFPSYLPPSIKGKFEVVFTNNIYAEPEDTVRRKFIHSDYTFATDNGITLPGGIGPSDSAFIAAGFFMQCGSLFFTGADGVCFHPRVTFGISNAQEIYIPGDPGANAINIFLYDADVLDDGNIDLVTSWEDVINGLIGIETYILNGTESADALLSVEMHDLLTGGNLTALKPFHPYYISLSYDGVQAGMSKCVRFSKSSKEDYRDFPTTPVYLSQLSHNGWDDGTVILRFDHITPFFATQAPLDEMTLTIAPNPAGEVLQMDLDSPNPVHSVTLLDGFGHRVSTQALQNFQKGRVSFHVNDLPSGIYLVNVATSSGSITRKLVISH